MKIQTLLIILMLTLSGCLGLNDAAPEIDPDDKFPNDNAAYFDTDDDGMPDELDGPSTSNPPLIADSDDDNDGFSDSMEFSCGTNPLLDTSFPDDIDGDFECDDQDFDIDGDGIYNSADAFPLDAAATTDTDGDGMPDTVTGESTLTEDTDDDNDGWSDADETECGSNSLVASLTPIDENGDGVCDSVSTDDDGDTYSDDEETQCGSDPLDALSIPSDLDGDTICDGLDDDEDGDGVSNAQDMYPRDPSKHGDIPGCIDEDAFNHDSDSNLDDGSCFGPEQAYSLMAEFMENETWYLAVDGEEDMDDDGEIDVIVEFIIVNDVENDALLIMQVFSDTSGEEMFNLTLLYHNGIIELNQYVSMEGEDGESIDMDDAVLIHDQVLMNPFMDDGESWYHCEQDVSGEWFCSNSDYFTMAEETSSFDCDDGTQVFLSQVNNGMSDCANAEDEPTWEEVEYSEFECNTGDYIYLSEVNDGNPDCPAAEDEPTYDPITQEETSTYECWSDGSLIDLSQVNDGAYDCDYGEDEPYFDEQDTSEFECADGSETLSLSDVNDGSYGCNDGSDEPEYSEVTGNSNSATDTFRLFTCDDGTMIAAEYVNDDKSDCADGSDEAQSMETTTYECANGEIIDFSLVNNGQADCTDGSDEENFFECDGGNSLPFNYVNDGYQDCEDGTDEPEYERGEELSMYDCADGSQVNLSKVNDENDDCSDGTDENPTHLDYDELVYFTCEETDSEILLSLANNGDEDCDDGSDEPEYDSMGDETSEYYCENPMTGEEDETPINLSQVNDGTEDCAFSWDEWTYASENWFGMERDNEEELNGDCQIDGEDFFVPWVFVNDGDDDCDDGADEPSFDSSGTETSTMTCWSGDVIALSLANDGNNDCPDEDDEILYMYVIILEGQSDSGETWSCTIPFDYLNDGGGDCQGNADEPAYDLGEELTFFDCDDGIEINLSQVNNGLYDCANDEDEPTWEEVEYTEFECNTGDYIYLSEVNDGNSDCPAGDDEPTYDPITQVETSTFECYDGSVIGLSLVNDGSYDCPYEADEPYYEEMDSSEFECADGSEIVSLSYVNDGYENCQDGSDEPEYDREELSVFTCNDGIEIPLSSVNDGVNDCNDGSDETNEFECQDRDGPLYWAWVNNGYEECQDGSDESDIEYVGNYTCHDGGEIPLQQVRDEYENCNDGSDEIYFDDLFEDCEWDSALNMWACSGMPMSEGIWSGIMASDGSWTITFEEPYDTFTIMITPEMTIESVTILPADDGPATYTAGTGGFVTSLNMELDAAAPPFILEFYGTPISQGNSTFECDDGTPIAFSSVNDGNDDCSESEDEPQYEQIETSGWDCETGEPDEWLWLSEVSDGLQHCLDGSDENLTALFECDDGSTITLDMVSDGTEDCSNAEDEPTYDEGDEEVSEFDCGNDDYLIPLSYVNDGDQDCENGSDENQGEGHGHGFYGVSIIGQSTEMLDIEWNGGSLTDSMSADGMDLVLAMCDSFEERESDLQVTECGDDVQRWSLAEIFAGDVVGIVFYDEDGSGTLTDGDSFEITEDLDGTLDWNAVRLAKDSAYADENPEVVLPGFTAALGIISMLGAALLVRKNE
jgi:hypothetical protein